MTKSVLLRYSVTAIAFSLLVADILHADSDLETTGDILAIGLPVAGLTGAILTGDQEGQRDWVYSSLTQLGTVHVIKVSANKTRPTTGRYAFPSGHTAGAFQGASFIQRRYGWNWGLPAYGLAALAGYSRYDADKHDAYDIAFGAAIGVFSTYIYTEPYPVGDLDIQLQPAFTNSLFGIQFKVSPADRTTRKARKTDFDADRKRNVQVRTGTDPTAIDNQLYTEISLLDQSGETDLSARRITGVIATVHGDWAFTENQLAGMDVSWVRNTQAPFEGQGFGDIHLNYRYRFYQDEDAFFWQARGAVLGIDGWLPLGNENRGIATDFWTVRPCLITAWTPIQNLNLYPGLSYYHSFDEGDSAPRLRMLGLELKVEYKFANGVYLYYWPEFFYRRHQEDKANHSMEIGIPLKKDLFWYFNYSLIGNRKWIHNPPDFGRPRYYDDIATIGLRWLF